MSQKSDDWAATLPPPPESIQQRWLYLMEPLEPEEQSIVSLGSHERRFARNIARWIMDDRGARRSLPTGYVVQAWQSARHPNAIVLMRTR